jgi:ParB family chromosome partitioning protein
MMQEQILEHAKARGFHPQTLARLLGWDPKASAALGLIVVALKIGENHLRDLMDWLEEIALRDNCGIEVILADKAIAEINSDPRLGRADKLKRFKDLIRRRRFPRLAQTEDMLRARIAELKLQPDIILSVPVGLEGGCLQVEFSASSQEELQQLAARLVAAAGKDATREAFTLLAGVAEDSRRTPQT